MKRLATLLLTRLPWVVAGLILAVMVTTVDAFRKPDYWLDLSQQFFAPAALALALMPIILTGGIDLSVGSVTVFASVVVGAVWQDAHWPLGWALAAGVLAGLLAGVVNAALVVAGIVPLVATLATRELFRGLAFTLVGESTGYRLPESLNEAWEVNVAGLPLPLLGIGLLFILMYLIVHHSWIGRMMYALGDNEQAARFAGLPVCWIKLGLYAWSGFVAGICGLGLVMRYGAAKPDAEPTLDMIAIACVVVGGVSIMGGSGHVAGTLLGIVTVASLLAGLAVTAPDWRQTITGALLIAVAVINEAGARWAARRPAQQAPSLARHAGVPGGVSS